MSVKVEAIKGGTITPEISKAVAEQVIYWSDVRLQHWFFDFKVGEQWISSRCINNELTEFLVEVF